MKTFMLKLRLLWLVALMFTPWSKTRQMDKFTRYVNGRRGKDGSYNVEVGVMVDPNRNWVVIKDSRDNTVIVDCHIEQLNETIINGRSSIMSVHHFLDLLATIRERVEFHQRKNELEGSLDRLLSLIGLQHGVKADA